MVSLNGSDITRFPQEKKSLALSKAVNFATQLHQVLNEPHVIRVKDVDGTQVLELVKNEK